MKTLEKNLSGAALVMGVIMALAFTEPYEKAGDKYAKVPLSQSSTGWMLIDDLHRDDVEPYDNQSYRCDDQDDVCTAEFSTPPTSPGSTPTGNVEEGLFIEN